MKVNMAEVLLNVEGVPLTERPNGPNLTLGQLCRAALLRDDQQADGEEKQRRHAFAVRLVGDPDIELKAEELVVLKELTGRFSPAHVGPAWRLLDGQEQLIATKKLPSPPEST